MCYRLQSKCPAERASEVGPRRIAIVAHASAYAPALADLFSRGGCRIVLPAVAIVVVVVAVHGLSRDGSPRGIGAEAELLAQLCARTQADVGQARVVQVGRRYRPGGSMPTPVFVPSCSWYPPDAIGRKWRRLAFPIVRFESHWGGCRRRTSPAAASNPQSACARRGKRAGTDAGADQHKQLCHGCRGTHIRPRAAGPTALTSARRAGLVVHSQVSIHAASCSGGKAREIA